MEDRKNPDVDVELLLLGIEKKISTHESQLKGTEIERDLFGLVDQLKFIKEQLDKKEEELKHREEVLSQNTLSEQAIQEQKAQDDQETDTQGTDNEQTKQKKKEEQAVQNQDTKNEQPAQPRSYDLPLEINLNNKRNAADDLPPTMGNISKSPPVPKEDAMPQNTTKSHRAINGMVGKPYCIELHELGFPDNITIERIEGIEASGLIYNKQESKIEGVPLKANDFTFPIIYTLSNHDIDRPEELDNRILEILINHDPHSLWKEKEPPDDLPYPKSHYDFDHKRLEDYHIIGASLRGRSHAHEGIFRDDDFVFESISDQVFFIAVADGAGSSKYSREGSRIACKKALESIRLSLEQHAADLQTFEDYAANKEDKELGKKVSQLAYNIIGETVRAARNAIIKQAEEQQHEIRDYHTTLLFSLILQLKNDFFLISYSIGDGIIAHIADVPKLLSKPDGGQFAGQTRFLTMSDSIDSLSERITATFLKNLSGLYLMTDGISDPYFETDANFEKIEKWNKLSEDINDKVVFDTENTKHQFKEWLSFWSPGNHDDRTIAFITKKTTD